MHVVVAVDGSKQSLVAARTLTNIVDPAKVSDVTLVAVIRPLAAVGFADELSESAIAESALSFRNAAERALGVVAEALADWGPKVHQRVRSGSPATEILKVVERYDAGLLVVGAGAGRADAVLGSTTQRVQFAAPCPVLVVKAKAKRKAAKR